MTERPGGAGVFPNQQREPDAAELEHDVDPQDMADAYVELVDQGYVHDDVALVDEWWAPEFVRERRRYRR